MAVFQNIIQVLFPSTCACCGQVLVRGERQVCINCLSNLAETRYGTIPGNAVERLLVGRIRIEAATALYHFRKGNTVQSMVHAMKFHGNTELCRMMGRLVGLDLLRSGRFDSIDVIVPVPLHWWRRLWRGYNQSELLCRGIAEVLHREVNTKTMVRHRYTRQQSKQKGEMRAGNVEGAFYVRHPERLTGKHVLLVDDVLTTGATITACADALIPVQDIKISVAVFSIAT